MSARESDNDHAAVRLPPPLVFALGILVGGLLNSYVAPIAIPLSPSWRIAAATIVGAIALALLGGAFGLFRRTGQKPEPWKTTPEIVSTGVFALSRNPMYISMALIQTCVGLGWNNGWPVLLAPVSLAVVFFTAIRHEERYLEAKFGTTYLDYKCKVRRWL